MTIFLDASFFYALKNSSDVHHEKAKQITTSLINEHLITTDYIFDEIVTVTLRKANKEIALDIGRTLIDSEVTLARIDPFVFIQAWSLFQITNSLSFTDCTSIAFMKTYGIQKIVTFDKGFLEIKDINVINC